MNTRILGCRPALHLASLLVLISVAPACGGGGGGNGGSGGLSNIGYVDINSPTDNPAIVAETSIYMSGTTFLQATTVTWKNEATGVTGSANHQVRDVVEYLLDTPITVTVHSWSALVPLTEGDNNIKISAADGMGGYGEASTVVTSGLVLQITAPSNPGPWMTNGTPFAIGGTAAGCSKVTWSVSPGGATGDATGIASWNALLPLSPGPNTVTVQAANASGTSLSLYRLVTYDPTAAVIIDTPTTQNSWYTHSGSVDLAGSAASPTTQVLWANAATGDSGVAAGVASWSATVPLKPGVGNVITITADNGTSFVGDRTITVTMDTTVPIVLYSAPSVTALTTLALSGTASDDVAVAQVTWSNSTTGGSGAATGTDSWSASIPLVQGANAITVQAVDLAGNQTSVAATVTLKIEAQAWGQNSAGQVGDGTLTLRNTPTPVSGLTGVISVSAGDHHMVAVLGDGSMRAWGLNDHGQLGDGTTVNRLSPVTVTGLSGVVWAAAGVMKTLAIRSDHTVWRFGGAFGSTPVQVSGLSTAVTGATGWTFDLALLSDGTVASWGSNNYGQLGDGTTVDHDLPMQVSGLSNVVAISTGWNHALALLADGTVRAWGINFAGQLGDGTTTNQSTPQTVSGLSGVTAISASENYSLALLSDGTVLSWGRNLGQLGRSTGSMILPGSVEGVSGVTAISAGWGHVLAILGDTTVMAWGSNQFGELGTGSYTNASLPTAIPGLTGVLSVSGGGYNSVIRQ